MSLCTQVPMGLLLVQRSPGGPLGKAVSDSSFIGLRPSQLTELLPPSHLRLAPSGTNLSLLAVKLNKS